MDEAEHSFSVPVHESWSNDAKSNKFVKGENRNNRFRSTEPTNSRGVMDLFHNSGQIKYSFVSMLISRCNLAAMGKIQKNI